MVFDGKERTDDRPKARGEGLFAFYDRSSRQPVAVFRDTVNAWMGDIPPETAAEITARMRKGDDVGFATGLSELMLHAVLVRLGFHLEPHPDMPGTAKKLDFLLRRPAGDRVAYLEITSINPAAARVARERREAVVFEGLNAATLPEDLRLGYEVAAFGKASPSAKKVRTAVERWAADGADAARAGADVQEVFAIDDWKFKLALLAGFRPGADGRQIALHGIMDGRFVGELPSTEGLAKVLDEKASKYGELDLPYVIAVFDRTDSLAWFSRDFPENVSAILFGSEGIEAVGLASGEIHTREARNADGWFGHPGAPRRRGVSAVLVFPSAEPWYLAELRGQPLLVRNPWAELPLPHGVLPVNEFVIDEREGRVVAGRRMSEILELTDPWPPQDA